MPRMSYSALDTDGSPTADPRDDIVRKLLAQQAGGGKPGAWAPSAMDAEMKSGYTTAPMVRGDAALTPGQKIQIASDAELAMQDARNGGDPGVRYANTGLAINRANEQRRDITNLDTPDIMEAKRQAALTGIQSGTVAAAADIAKNDLSRIQASNKATIARQIATDGGFLTDKDRRDMARASAGLGEDADAAALREVNRQLITDSISGLSSPVPAVRQAAAARLRRAGVDPGDPNIGPKGDPAATESFLSNPAAKLAVDRILERAKGAAGSFRPEIAAQDVRTALAELAEQARQAGADPEQITAMVQEMVRKAVPRTSFWNSPIRTTLGLGGTLFDTSENTFNDALGR